jgi:murein DD-endopeptidase MepM/ murein hydrolase activator NlpD
MARYFVHLPPDGSPAIFWREIGNFCGLPFHYNLNLLARAVGDDPTSILPAWAELVPPHDYNFGEGTVRIQPLAFTPQGGNVYRPEALPIGPNLRRFLDNPLNGEKMDLSLPFYDEDIKLGPSGGGWFTKENNDAAFHGGTDFNKRPRAVFDVCAAAEGIVTVRASENGKHGGVLVLTHTTPSGKEFRTVYQHVDMTTTPTDLKAGAAVRRGQYLGRTSDVSIIHLHFGVAVQGPSALIHGVNLPSLWYFIDPWGVYDYYEHDNRSNGNYLPPEGQADIFQSRISGSVHTVQWRTQPLAETIPIARNTEGYKKIIRIQSRLRSNENIGGTPPREMEQFQVWLKEDPDSFLILSSQPIPQNTQIESMTLLREAFIHEKPVRLEYRYEGAQRYITAISIEG